jgi:hypothetical protein
MDGNVNESDAPIFVDALLDPETYQNQRTQGTIGSADMNLDGVIDGRDTQLFVNKLLGQ